jgi:hypothetical protein
MGLLKKIGVVVGVGLGAGSLLAAYDVITTAASHDSSASDGGACVLKKNIVLPDACVGSPCDRDCRPTEMAQNAYCFFGICFAVSEEPKACSCSVPIP